MARRVMTRRERMGADKGRKRRKRKGGCLWRFSEW